MSNKIKIGIIGFGRMGRFYSNEMQKSGRWDIVYICDTNIKTREIAGKMYPGSKIIENEEIIFADKEIQVVGLFALANSRKKQIEKAICYGKHIISEKPVADTIDREMEVVKMIENSKILSTVNLYLRNSWYHIALKEFINRGEIGELAIIRVCHLTPGLAPGEGHEYEGPSFHDCGMHYVDIARWYVGCEYKTWNAQALKMWNYKEPWWLQCHGTFENGVVFDITQGHVYGQLSRDKTHNSYIDIIGTKGIARMTHDFVNATVELYGINQTIKDVRPFGGKNIDVLCDLFANSINSGYLHPKLPTIKDSVVASEYAWRFLDDAKNNELPAIGDLQTLEKIREHRKTLKNGYGLLHINN